jgi:hypothetical protein
MDRTRRPIDAFAERFAELPQLAFARPTAPGVPQLSRERSVRNARAPGSAQERLEFSFPAGRVPASVLNADRNAGEVVEGGLSAGHDFPANHANSIAHARTARAREKA